MAIWILISRFIFERLIHFLFIKHHAKSQISIENSVFSNLHSSKKLVSKFNYFALGHFLSQYLFSNSPWLLLWLTWPDWQSSVMDLAVLTVRPRSRQSKAEPAAEQQSGSHSLYTAWPPTPTPTDTFCPLLYVSSLGVAFWHDRQRRLLATVDNYVVMLTFILSS